MSGNGPTAAHIAARLAELRAQHEQGADMLAQLDAQTSELRERLLRISGAIQVCEELLLAGGDAG